MLKLFRILKIFLNRYSKMATKNLIDHYLRIKIILKLSALSVDAYLSETDIAKSAKTIFLKKTRSQKQSQFTLIVFDHPQLIKQTQLLLEEVSDCIIIDNNSSKQVNNIIFGEKKKITFSRAVLVKLQRQSYEYFIELLDAYLSIIELFHGHTHAIVNCFEAQYHLDINKQLQSVGQGDEFQGINDEGYFKILEERASKITLDQLSNSCKLKVFQWGHSLEFEGGHDGLVVWITQNYFPKLGSFPLMPIPCTQTKKYPIYLQTEAGLKIFKKRQFFKQKIQNLNLTTIIFNIKRCQKDTQQQISKLFQQYTKIFFSNILMNKQLDLLQQNIKNGQRICKILGIGSDCLLKRLLQL